MRFKVLAGTLVAVLMGSTLASGQTTGVTQVADSAVSSSSNRASEGVVSDHKQNPDSEGDRLLDRLTPHPYLYLGPSFTRDAGYATFAYRAESGFNVESHHWVMKALAAYDSGRKVADADQPNPTGHTRYLEGGIYYRPASLPSPLAFLGAGHWFAGAGYRWSQLSTSNYIKGSNRPEIGGGYDLITHSCAVCGNFSMRIALDWVMAGNDWQNGSHGPETTIIFPTPRENRHWFYQTRFAVYRFHETVTDPSNAMLAPQQESQKGLDRFLDTGIVFRL